MKILADLVTTLRLVELAKSAAFGTAMLLTAVVAVHVAERRQGVAAGRLLTRHFATDVAWALFYRSGLYVMFILSIATNALGSRAQFLRLELLPNTPSYIAVPVYLILGDFVLYWIHRLNHAVPALWAFHMVHHSQEQLGTLTQYRRHPVEMFWGQVVLFVVFVMVLGIPMHTWIPLYAVLVALQALQHAELNWRFGRVYPLVVSPVFHSIHHSTDPRHANTNFGAMFSFWDYVFGTAIHDAPRPAQYGVPGLTTKESFLAQLVLPFQVLGRQLALRRLRAASQSEPGGAAESLDSASPVRLPVTTDTGATK